MKKKKNITGIFKVFLTLIELSDRKINIENLFSKSCVRIISYV